MNTDLDQIAETIRSLYAEEQTAEKTILSTQDVASKCRENIGKQLVIVYNELIDEKGGFVKWVKENCPFKRRAAYNYLRPFVQELAHKRTPPTPRRKLMAIRSARRIVHSVFNQRIGI